MAVTSPVYVPTIRNGGLATGGVNSVNQDQLRIDMMDEVFEYDKAASPLMIVLTKKGNRRPAKQTTVKHMEDEQVPEWDTTTASAGSGVTAITVTNPNYHKVGEILAIPRTGEQVRVTGVSVATSTLTITRAWAGSATAMNSGEQLLLIATPEMEGDLSPVAKQTITTTKTNFTQIVKTPVHVTNTNEAADHYSGSERARQRRKAFQKHARDWEQIAFHGRKKEDTSTGSAPIRAAGGLDEYITSNVLTAAGSLTEAEFVAWLGDVFRYNADGSTGPKTKWLFTSRALAANIWSWGSSKLEFAQQGSMAYGIEINRYQCQFGSLAIVNHPLLENAYSGYGYVVDVDGVYQRPYRETKLETDIQAPGEDGKKDQVLTEMSFSFPLEAANGKITGVTF